MYRYALIGIVVALFVGFAVAQDEVDDTIKPEELAADMKRYEGMGQTFRDVVAQIYKYVDIKKTPKVLRFDTNSVRCQITINDNEDWRLIDAWGRGEIDDIKGVAEKFKDKSLQLLWTVYFGEIQPQIVSITGNVIEPEESGGFGYFYVFDVEKIERVKYKSRQ